jgi:Predicted ATPases of PP-loop superfamily
MRSSESHDETLQAKLEPILFCWSGGKDSAMALHTLRQQKGVRVAALLTTVTSGYERITMHGVRRSLLLQQAQRLGLALHEVRIPPQCVNSIYEEQMRQALVAIKSQGVCRVAFGDIFLQDLREYRERNLAKVGMTALFPIWKLDTQQLATDFCAAGFRAIAVCIDATKLPREFAGKELDQEFFSQLPEGVDPCGENGEFHTFVYDGPIFSSPVPFDRGEVVERDGFYSCDLKERVR